MNVLILEDRFFRAFQVARVVGNAGHTVVGPFSSPDDALHVGEATKPDLALLSLDHAKKFILPHIAMILNSRWSVHCLYVGNDPMAGNDARDFALGQILRRDAKLLTDTLNIVSDIIEDTPFAEVPAGLLLYHHYAELTPSRSEYKSTWDN